jgi:hypothetical protein
MSELDDFLTETLARQVEAEKALHNGDPTLRMQMWSTQDPVTLQQLQWCPAAALQAERLHDGGTSRKLCAPL